MTHLRTLFTNISVKTFVYFHKSDYLCIAIQNQSPIPNGNEKGLGGKVTNTFADCKTNKDVL